MVAGPQPFYVGDDVLFPHRLLGRTFKGTITKVTKRRVHLTLDDPPEHVQRVHSFTWAQAAKTLRYDHGRTGGGRTHSC